MSIVNCHSRDGCEFFGAATLRRPWLDVTFLTRVKKVTKKTRKGFALNPCRIAAALLRNASVRLARLLHFVSQRRASKGLLGENLVFAA